MRERGKNKQELELPQEPKHRLETEARHTEMNSSNTWSLNSNPTKQKPGPWQSFSFAHKVIKTLKISHLDEEKHVDRMLFFSRWPRPGCTAIRLCPTVNHSSKLEAGHMMFAEAANVIRTKSSFLYWYFISGISVSTVEGLFAARSSASAAFCKTSHVWKWT